MNLSDLLKLKFPTANMITDIIIQDDGKGPYIKQWNLQNTPQPTPMTLVSWQTDPTTIQQYTFQQNSITNAPIYAQLQNIDIKSIRSLRESDTVYLASLTSQAIALRSQLLPTS